MRSPSILTIALGLLVTCGVSFGVAADAPVILIPDSAGDSCVEPVPVIRRQHMKLLLEQRDMTVRDGVRSGKHGLSGCVACHANRDGDGHAIPVNDPGQFCESCHRFAGVRMDCFGCHATKPDE